MKPIQRTLYKFILALLTVLALLAHPYIPLKNVVIYPRSDAVSDIYGPAGSANWLARANSAWRCDYRRAFTDNSCGFIVSWTGGEQAASALRPPSCSSAATDHDGDGWGWEHQRSCLVPAAVRAQRARPTAEFPLCDTLAADLDGDGWGWEDEHTCRMPNADAAADNSGWHYCALSGSDPDGDGWGREEDAACVVRGGASDPQVSGERSPGENAVYCSNSIVDGDGDGWGWEQNRSCLIPPTVDRTQVPQPNKAVAQLRGVDMSSFKNLRVTLNYEGKAEFLRLYVRNFDPADADLSLADTTKYMITYLHTEDLKAGAAQVPLSQFRVAEWWLEATDRPLAHASRDLNNVVRIGFDFLEHGVHKIQVGKIELQGERISWPALVFMLNGLWFVLACAELGYPRYRRWRAAQRGEPHSPLQDGEVTDSDSALVPMATLITRFQAIHRAEHSGLLVVRVDLTDERAGIEAANALGREVGRLLSQQHYHQSYIAQQADGEVVLLLCGTSLSHLEHTAEQIHRLVDAHDFSHCAAGPVIAHVGFTLAINGEAFEETLNRAEWALYQTLQTHSRLQQPSYAETDDDR
ncbi:hypothetical protein [Teredinibacter turnerae]|uniref:hypothetical protein n=1 Tax=Teredinibacter turnerae TaxID=2426 RepID=UPI00036058DE|nr:hypothetical protein [Teredinibacter turnerae]